MVPFLAEKPAESPNLPSSCKRERSDELSFAHKSNKRPMHDDPNCSNANGSEDSTTTSQNPDPSTNMMMTNNLARSPLEFPLLEPKEHQNVQKQTFDSSNLEKAVPPGYLKFISNLENEILNVSMERETLKIELMRAQAMINILQSRVEFMSSENDDLRRRG